MAVTWVKMTFFHSFIQQIFIAHHALGTVLGSGNRTSKTDRNPCPCGAYILLGKTDNLIHEHKFRALG